MNMCEPSVWLAVSNVINLNYHRDRIKMAVQMLHLFELLLECLCRRLLICLNKARLAGEDTRRGDASPKLRLSKYNIKP